VNRHRSVMPLAGKTPVLTPRTFVAPRYRQPFYAHFWFSRSRTAAVPPSSATCPSERTALSGTMQLFQVPSSSLATAFCAAINHPNCRQSERWFKFKHFGEQCGHCVGFVCSIYRLECCHRTGNLLVSCCLAMFVSPLIRVQF
jgi:hypothetical protein